MSLTEARRRAESPEVLLALARVHQARGEAVAARDLVDRAGDLLGARERLRAAAPAAWPEGVRILLEQGDVAAAAAAAGWLMLAEEARAVEAMAARVGSPVMVEPLTEREREILQLLAAGCSNQDVAQRLFMGVSTVKWHLINIYGKLQVGSRTQAVARAREVGLL